MKTYIINLKESHERRKYILEEVAKYPFMEVELVEAVNGRKLTRQETDERFDSLKFTCRYGRLPQPGEIGCTLSHRICYQKLLDSKEEVALILEDDVFFTTPETVESVITESVRFIAGKGAGMVLFTPEHIHYTPGKVLTGAYTIYTVFYGYGTWAYLINRKAAERMLRIKRPSIWADDYSFIRRLGVKVQCVYPSISQDLSTCELLSGDIEEERKLYTYKPKGWMKIWTIYYRMCDLFVGWERGLRFRLGQLKKSYSIVE